VAILVTGGCGLGGSFAVRHAVELGIPVVAYDIAQKTELLHDVLDRVQLVKGDITSAPELMRAVQEYGVDRILHTASFLTGPAYERPYAAAQTMVMGTLNVLETARSLKLKRVVHVSTGKTRLTAAQVAKSVGTGRMGVKADPYTSCKLVTELLCNDYRQLYNMDVVILHFSQLFGPGYDFSGGSGRGLKPIVETALRGEKVTVSRREAALTSAPPAIEPEPPLRPTGMLYARDAGRAAMLATLSDKLQDWVFRISPKEQLTMFEIVQCLKKLIPGAQIEVSEPPEKGGPVEPDPRAKEQFGYVPEYDVERGFREYIAFLKTGIYKQIPAGGL